MSPDDGLRAGGLPAGLRDAARRYATRPAVVDGGRSTDFATFDRLTDRAAAALHRRGIVPGDRVGLYGANSAAFALAYCAILKAGATVVPANLLLHPREVAWIYRDAGIRALIWFDALREKVDAFHPELDDLRLSVVVGQAPAPPGHEAWTTLLAEEGTPPAPAIRPSEDVAAILYTSGTTGHPKGAMLTHRNLLANTTSVQQALRLRSGEETFLVVLPMFHSFAATVGMLFPLLHGCTIAPLARFDPELVARTIQATSCTVFLGVPSMYSVLLRLPEEHVELFSSLEFCVSGGAALPPEVLTRFEERFGKLIYEGDGPTECSPVTCVNPIGGLRKIGTVGPPVPGVEMRIVDGEGQELPRGEVGEICVRGDNVMKGYWNRPEATRESFFGEWFRTGDLGTEDEDGYFTIVDRQKDMIIVNGVNVYPRVIEDVLYRQEGIREAAVVGEPSRLHGEIPVAWIARVEGSELSEDEVRAFCREHLGGHEIPRRVRFVDALPRNASGKVLKRQLRIDGEVERGVDPREC